LATAITKIRADREEWVKNNPEKLELVQELKNELMANQKTK
jgi:hypothetical protein